MIKQAPRYRTALLLILLVAAPVLGQSGGEFTPLIGSAGLERFVGDRRCWSFAGGVLASRVDGSRTSSALILSTERLGNFILKFKARGGEVRVVFRARIQPPGQVLGYEVEVGGQRPGNLTARKPAAWAPSPGPGGMPARLEMPFLREASDVQLSGSTGEGAVTPDGEWADYEISGLGDHLIVKVNGEITAHYRAERGPGEGMLGFRLPAGNGTGAELKDIQVRLLGEVRWPTMSAAGDLGSAPAEGWTASARNFERTSDDRWKKESRELLKLAEGTGFRPLLNGNTLAGWRAANGFWSAKEGGIEGASHNSFLVTEKEYANFILKGSVRLVPPEGNSGVQVRSTVIADGMRGYQFDMGVPWWGQLYSESTPRGILVPVDDREKRMRLTHLDGWNDFVVICSGNHLIGILNGEVTYDLVDYYGERTGLIGLQVHLGGPMKVDFRSLKIKELP